MEHLGEGLFITMAGMGIVFLGLSILWGAIVVLDRVFREKSAADLEEADGEGPEAGLAAE